MDLKMISSEELIRRLGELLSNERQVQVKFLEHLEEFDRRREFAALAYATLWDYCTKALGLLDCATWRRTHSVRILRRFPFVGEYLQDGRLTMTTLVLLEDLLTPENARELLEKASKKSKREVEWLVASMRPSPAPAEMVRKLPAARESASAMFEVAASMREDLQPPSSVEVARATPTVAGADRHSSLPVDEPTRRISEAFSAENRSEMRTASPPPRIPERVAAKIEAISAGEYVVRLTVDRQFVEMLERAKATLSHVNPRGELVEVFRRGLKEILDREERRRTPTSPKRADRREKEAQGTTAALGTTAAQSTKAAWGTKDAKGTNDAKGRQLARAGAPPNAPETDATNATEIVGVATAAIANGDRRVSGNVEEKPRRPAIPIDVERAVRMRDGNCCAWIGPSGRRCGSTWQVELDHIDPVARGGESTVENLRLLCRAHNDEAARRVFGDDHMNRFRATG